MQVNHEPRSFRFGGLGHLAEYLITNPNCELCEPARHDAATLAAALRERPPDRPVLTSSTNPTKGIEHVIRALPRSRRPTPTCA